MDVDVLDTIDMRRLGQELQLARRQKGLTQGDAAKLIDATRTTMVAIEKGDRRVRSSELIRLARAYGRTVNDFVRRRPAIDELTVQFRGPTLKTAEDDKAIAPVVAAFQDLCRNYLELEQLTGSPVVRKYPSEYTISEQGIDQAAEIVALDERNRLNLGDGPVPLLRDLLDQDVGLRVFYLPMPAKFSGIYFFTEQLGGCIAVNSLHPEERRRWSLAHDYDHFLSARHEPHVSYANGYQRLPASERHADAFARYFLMPTAGLLRRFSDLQRKGKVTLADLCLLAHYYGVSVEALVRRLEAMRLLPVGMWEKLQGRFVVRDVRKELGLTSIPTNDQRLPARYRLLAVEAFEQGAISEGQLARFLNVDRLEAREIASILERSYEESTPHDEATTEASAMLGA